MISGWACPPTFQTSISEIDDSHGADAYKLPAPHPDDVIVKAEYDVSLLQ